MDDDWDLFAVVRGCATPVVHPSSDPRPPSPLTWTESDHRFMNFPGRFEIKSPLEELHELYKPFFLKPRQPACPQSISFERKRRQRFDPEKEHQKERALHGVCSQVSRGAKRRKNQQKRVCNVPAEGLTTDVWAWRKYGQKPIKGSPYPRGYYKCSSSKGCLARKQVERNKSDPAMYVVTYTADHNHPAPTHRNSLAGSTRQKPSGEADSSKSDKNSPPSPASGTSNTTSLKEDQDGEIGDVVVEGVDEEDFFSGLEEIVGPVGGDYFSDEFVGGIGLPWMENTGKT